ncbi:hypothetical protein NHF46_00525 [Arthrobacter alpinus]|nr:hypothetical protein [Arthrobacter alpinus]
MASGGVRVVRGWAGACVATFVSVISHVLAGGGPPELSILFLALALSGLVCTLLAGRVLSWWRMAVAVVLSQSGFHWLFSANAAMADTSAVLPKGVHAGHDMSNMTFMTVPGSAPMAMTHDGPMMWLSHVLAAAVTVACCTAPWRGQHCPTHPSFAVPADPAAASRPPCVHLLRHPDPAHHLAGSGPAEFGRAAASHAPPRPPVLSLVS